MDGGEGCGPWPRSLLVRHIPATHLWSLPPGPTSLEKGDRFYLEVWPRFEPPHLHIRIKIHGQEMVVAESRDGAICPIPCLPATEHAGLLPAHRWSETYLRDRWPHLHEILSQNEGEWTLPFGCLGLLFCTTKKHWDGYPPQDSWIHHPKSYKQHFPTSTCCFHTQSSMVRMIRFEC